MLRTVLLVAALTSPALAADECSYVADGRYLYFVHAGSVATVVDRDFRDLPYVCTTSTLGTGIAGRALTCSDGFDGPLVFKDDDEIEFRGSTWRTDCPDNAATDIGFGN